MSLKCEQEGDDVLMFVILSGMDTQLVVRPLLDRVEKNTQESALRKIAFPHVSTYLVAEILPHSLSQIVRVEEQCLELIH